MGEADDSERGRGIGPAAMAAFVNALRQGARREDAAAAGGFTLDAFYRARRRDPLFRAAWAAAWAASALAERWPPPEPGGAVEARIVPNNRRALQRRWMRHMRFDGERRKAFFAHFLQNCDARAAAAYAGVSESTVSYHRRTDPGFAAEYEEVVGQAYVTLEAEALRQRLAAQQALRAAIESIPPRALLGEGDHAEHGGGAPPSGLGPATSPTQVRGGLDDEIAAEFERVLKLLARLDRGKRRPDRHAAPEGRRQVWTFDAAIELLGKRLKALGLTVPPLPPEEAARYDGPDGAEGEDGLP